MKYYVIQLLVSYICIATLYPSLYERNQETRKDGVPIERGRGPLRDGEGD